MKVIYIPNKIRLIIIYISLIIIIVTAIFFFRNNKDFKYIEVSNLEERIFEAEIPEKKVAYLTFDDGPSIKETNKILDILREEDVKATFFVIGKNVKEHPELVKREFEEGHYVANHGYSHDNKKLYKNSKNFESEIINTDNEIAKAIDVDNYCSHIFRFPNGFMSNMYKKQKKWALKKLNELNYFYLDWNCLNKDSELKTNNFELIRNLKITSYNKDKLVILMHDTGDVNNSSEVLRESIKYLKEQGYVFRNMYDFVSN